MKISELQIFMQHMLNYPYCAQHRWTGEQQNDPLILPLLLTILENNLNSIPNQQQALLDKRLNSFLKSCYAVKQPKHIIFAMSGEILKKATLH
jgi:hypothetical protein